MCEHLQALHSWLAGSCPKEGCPTNLQDVLDGRRQKAVDTLICVDAMSLAASNLTDIVLIASDDDDIVPAMLSARQHNKPVFCLYRRNAERLTYRDLLDEVGVEIHQW